MPRLEIGKPAPGVEGAADHDRDEHERRGPGEAKDPAAEEPSRGRPAGHHGSGHDSARPVPGISDSSQSAKPDAGRCPPSRGRV